MKGTRDSYIRMVEQWRKTLESRDDRERSFNDITWRILEIKEEKDGIKGTIMIGGSKCCITIFKSGTITLARSKSNPFEVVKNFAANILIPASLAIIQGYNDGTETPASENKCKHCGNEYATQDDLREHIDTEHVRIETMIDNDIKMRDAEDDFDEKSEITEQAKKKRKAPEMSEENVISDSDLLAQMNNAIKISNDKRERD